MRDLPEDQNHKGPCRRRIGGAVPHAENFGDLITADHKVLSEGCESRNNHRYAVVVQDLATQWIQSYPCKTKTSQETQRSLQKFMEPNRKPTVIYTDNSLEFGKACEDLSWNHCTSTPHRSETNGIAERAVRRVKEGTSAVLWQSSLDKKWWADSMECYTYLRHIQDLFSDGKTLYERWLGVIYSQRPNVKEVIFPKEDGKFILPAAGGRIKLSGRDQELRTPTLIREHPIRGGSQRDFLREAEGFLPPPPQDSIPDASEAINDFRSMSGNFKNHHPVEPRVKLCSPR